MTSLSFYSSNFNHIVDNLKSKLANCTKEFTVVLQMRTRNLKHQHARRKQFESDSDFGMRKRRPATGFGDHSGSEGDQNQGAMYEEQQQQSSRNRVAVEQIETTIAELGQMYGRLVHMVGSQEETVIRIDSNMDQTLANVESGHSQLVKYYDRLRGDQGLILKIFLVIILVGVLLIVTMR
jgi:syntaxin 5